MLKSKNENLSKKIKTSEIEIASLKSQENAVKSSSDSVTHDMLQVALQQLETNIMSKINERIADATQRNDEQQPHNNERNESKTEVGGNANKSLLKPPKEKATTDDRAIYEIHVGNFHTDMIPKTIEAHIMANTEIVMPELFKVEQMRSRFDKSDYATFKITTLNKQTYTQIMDTKLWEPEYTAHDFVQRSVKFSKITTNDGNVEMNKGNRNNVAMETPRSNNYTKKSYGRQKFGKFNGRSTFNTPQRKIQTETPQNRSNMKTPNLQQQQTQPYFLTYPYMYYNTHQPQPQTQQLQSAPMTQLLQNAPQTNTQTAQVHQL